MRKDSKHYCVSVRHVCTVQVTCKQIHAVMIFFRDFCPRNMLKILHIIPV